MWVPVFLKSRRCASNTVPETVSHCSALLLWLLNFETSTLDLETCTLKCPRRGATRDRER